MKTIKELFILNSECCGGEEEGEYEEYLENPTEPDYNPGNVCPVCVKKWALEWLMAIDKFYDDIEELGEETAEKNNPGVSSVVSPRCSIVKMFGLEDTSLK